MLSARHLHGQSDVVQPFSVGWRNEPKLINSFKRSSSCSDVTDFRRRFGQCHWRRPARGCLDGSVPKRRGGSPFCTAAMSGWAPRPLSKARCRRRKQRDNSVTRAANSPAQRRDGSDFGPLPIFAIGTRVRFAVSFATWLARRPFQTQPRTSSGAFSCP